MTKQARKTDILDVASPMANLIFYYNFNKLPEFEKILFYLHIGCLRNFSCGAQMNSR